MAPLESIDDSVQIEVPFNIVVTYDATSEARERFAKYPPEAQEYALRQHLEPYIRQALAAADYHEDDIVFGLRPGGE